MFGERIRPSKEYILIIGCGSLGRALACAMDDEGKDVCIMDKAEESALRLPESFCGRFVEGDAVCLEDLLQAGIEAASIVYVVTGSDSVNIMAAQIARNMYGKQKVFCRLYDEERSVVYREMGIGTIYPSVKTTLRMNEILEEGNALA